MARGSRTDVADLAPRTDPQFELSGSPAERLNLLDAVIARLRELRRALAGDDTDVPYEVLGPYINAPVWPWTVAGWTLAVFFTLLFLFTWLRY